MRKHILKSGLRVMMAVLVLSVCSCASATLQNNQVKTLDDVSAGSQSAMLSAPPPADE